MNSNILNKKEYLCPSRFNTGRIIEYDIRAANINVLFYKKVISEDKYKYLNNLPKMQREIVVGNMIRRDNTLYRILSDGILEFRDKFIEYNNIKEEEIMRIANDAIYVNRYDTLKYTKFDNVEFVPKNEYSNMTRLLDLIIFSKYIDNNIDIDVKGLGKNAKLHQQYMLSIIANTIYLYQRVSLQDAIKYLSNMYEQYVRRQLPIGFYRQLNSYSGYLVLPYNMIILDVNINDINMVDIRYNLSYLRELHNILFENFH